MKMQLNNWIIAIIAMFLILYALIFLVPEPNIYLAIPACLIIGYSWVCSGSDHDEENLNI